MCQNDVSGPITNARARNPPRFSWRLYRQNLVHSLPKLYTVEFRVWLARLIISLIDKYFYAAGKDRAKGVVMNGLHGPQASVNFGNLNFSN